MPGLAPGSCFRLLPISLVLAACLNACLLDPDPDPDPQASRTSQALAADAPAAAGTVLAFRVALPESAVGQIDSAELRMRSSGGKQRSWSLAVSDSILEAELSDLDPGPAEFEVVAFASGKPAYYGSLALDPSQAGTAAVTVALGRVGRVRIEAGFGGGMD